jgi:hypothetical protein
MEFLLIAVIIGLIPGWVAHSKGRSFLAWWFFGFLLWIVAMPASLIISKDERAIAERDGRTKKCPACAEWIAKEARKCKYCQSELPGDKSSDK